MQLPAASQRVVAKIVFLSMKPISKGGRGGARQGAGRKKTKGRNFNFRATPEVEEILDGVVGSKTDYINAAVKFYNEMGRLR